MLKPLTSFNMEGKTRVAVGCVGARDHLVYLGSQPSEQLRIAAISMGLARHDFPPSDPDGPVPSGASAPAS
jgi:hypothetical protein